VVLRLALAAGLLAVIALIAWRLRTRPPNAPSRDAYPVPRQLDRADFDRPDAPWLVAYFSSATCGSCQNLAPKVALLACTDVSVADCSFEQHRSLHDRYEVAAIPMILIADHQGVVQKAFVGATSATDLWAAVAEVRAPGSTPEPRLGDLDAK
jgi:hypothetical protein